MFHIEAMKKSDKCRIKKATATGHLLPGIQTQTVKDKHINEAAIENFMENVLHLFKFCTYEANSDAQQTWFF